ncbi:MAG: hypothetical protein K2Q14_03090 [Gammaproteobacteria bacterium]|nr:hypothetical protein [Gammaproteobacteria bacterium]
MSESKIDLNEIANNSNLSVSITSMQEEHPQDACIRRVKDIALFIVALLFVIAAFCFGAYLLLSSTSSSDDKKWGMAISSSILSAFLGFLMGKKSVN